MPTATLQAQQANLLMRGTVALMAADPSDQQAKGNAKGFRMVLYTGSVFAGHWYWGDVYLDLSGFKPSRTDLPALLRHENSKCVGFTTALAADAAKKQITAEGTFLNGDTVSEPYANLVRSRLEQGFPYQCSGRWEPRRVEQVEAGAQSSVNGATVQGPCAIFREYDLGEASFAEQAWDPMTSAMAASAEGKQLPAANVEIIGKATPKEHAMPKTNLTLLASLRDIVGTERAVELITGKPEAETLEAFAPELATELKTVRADLTAAKATITAKDGEIATLKTDLAAAKAAPVVATITGDPANPSKPAAGGTVEAFKQEWQESPDLQAEFPKQEVYVHFRQNQKEG